jgi:hypothetical protein
VNGPGSLKRFYFAPREPLLQIETGERALHHPHEYPMN